MRASIGLCLRRKGCYWDKEVTFNAKKGIEVEDVRVWMVNNLRKVRLWDRNCVSENVELIGGKSIERWNVEREEHYMFRNNRTKRNEHIA